jgi:Protein of unknown function (DUF2892)
MKALLVLLASPTGRLTRVAAGVVLVVLGIALGGAWWILAAIGLVPLLAGAFDVCLLAPLFRQPLHGAEFRHNAAR